MSQGCGPLGVHVTSAHGNMRRSTLSGADPEQMRTPWASKRAALGPGLRLPPGDPAGDPAGDRVLPSCSESP